MHDGIQKFSRELNGSFVLSLSETNKIVIMPWGLTEIREGSLNAERLYNHLVHRMSSIKPVKNSTFSECAQKSGVKVWKSGYKNPRCKSATVFQTL